MSDSSLPLGVPPSSLDDDGPQLPVLLAEEKMSVEAAHLMAKTLAYFGLDPADLALLRQLKDAKAQPQQQPVCLSDICLLVCYLPFFFFFFFFIKTTII